MVVRSRAAALVATLVLAGALAWWLLVRPRVIAARQLANWVTIQVSVYSIEQYRKVHGAYPTSLSALASEASPVAEGNRGSVDTYGHPLHYESDGERFLVVSFGRDGRQDRSAYARVGATPQARSVPCQDPNVDTAFSSDGVFQACAK